MSPAPPFRPAGGPDQPAPFVRVSLLGPVRAWDGEGGEIAIPGRKPRALLGILLMARGRPVSRARLAALLWERSAEAEARGSLRQAVLELTRAFGAVPLLRRDGESLRADPACCVVDALTLPAGGAPPDGMPALMDGLEGIGEGFDDWLQAERDAFLADLRARQEARLEALAEDPARSEEAIQAARGLVALDPSHEPGWRALMLLLASAGNRAQALAEYERCEAALRRALDLEPSAETQQLAARLRAPSRAALLPPAPPPPSEDGRLRVGVIPARLSAGQAHHPLTAAYAHDVALELVRYRHFDVLHPSALEAGGVPSSEAFRGLGLDYIVTTAIRREAEGSSLVLSLLEVSGPARPIWSARAPLGGTADELDSEALGRLVARLEPVILHTEGTRPVPKRVTDASAIVLRAIPLMFSMEAPRFFRAGEMLADAVTREPENAMAAAWAAQWHVFQIGQSWAPDPAAALEEAERLAVLAMSLDPESAEAAAIYGHVASFLHKDFDSAAYYLGRSLELNPHQASSWALSAATQTYSGSPKEALRQLERYRSLAPCHPHDRILSQVFTTAYAVGGDFEMALSFGRRAVRAAPGFVNGYKPVLSALGHLGLAREARPLIEALLRLEPRFNVAEFVSTYPFRRPEDREAYAEGLLRAGAPKG
ncbi:BTAD domain-containing putative transcriptional regulator [Muricoccus roseus]|uniref:BTAD domain-containing putative transcriptional regulator n=1 Tax=Muricoccus roseus TaxID=198092 RepID=UPI00093364D5|nr:BTAD domain-containing putative transcriptional regulator [Roseomonas rosea]